MQVQGIFNDNKIAEIYYIEYLKEGGLYFLTSVINFLVFSSSCSITPKMKYAANNNYCGTNN